MRCFGICGLFFLLGSCLTLAAAEPEMRLSGKKIREEVQVVVEAQLTALREKDFAAAYAMASSGLRARFNLAMFAAMIRQGYPPLLMAEEADLGVVRDQNGRQAQVSVTVEDRHKRPVVYRYLLVRETDGWRINGVVVMQKPPRADM